MGHIKENKGKAKGNWGRREKGESGKGMAGSTRGER